MTDEVLADTPVGGRVVVSLQGKDAPGICRDLMSVVASCGAGVVDVRQNVVRGRLRLVLELELASGAGAAATQDGLMIGIVRAAKRLGLSADFDVADGASKRRGAGYVLTLLSEHGIEVGLLKAVGEELARRGCAVEKVTRLSSKSLRCLELAFAAGEEFVGGDLTELRKEVYKLGSEAGADVALQADTVLRRAKRIVVMDMDSTLIQQEVIDELARYAGVYEKVQAITERAMNGELDFNASLEARVAQLKGTHEDVFNKVIANLVYTEGAHQLCRSLKKLGYTLAVISGGFTRVAAHVAGELGLDMHFANELETANGFFTGKTTGPIVNAQRKADLLETIAQREGVTLDQCVAIGDGSNDLPMLGIAGLGVAFNAKPSVQRRASFRINQRNLDSALYLLGFSENAQAALARRA